MDASPLTSSNEAASRLPPDARIGRVRLRVGDIGRSLELYRDVLGLEVTKDEGVRVSLGPPGSAGNRELIVLEEQPGITRRPAPPVSGGL
jgi:catechol 2,3-dioxygenase-like lactoylglutathione lyase family enzyme